MALIPSSQVWVDCTTDEGPRYCYPQLVYEIAEFDPGPVEQPIVVSPLSWASDWNDEAVLQAHLLRRVPRSLYAAGISDWDLVPPVPTYDTGGNEFLPVPMPGTAGTGAAVFIGNLAEEKTLLLTGMEAGIGNVRIDVSMDGTRWAQIAAFSPPLQNSADGVSGVASFRGLYKFLRVRRDGGGGQPSLDIAAETR